MRLNSLRDLELAGIRWELCENQSKKVSSRKSNPVRAEVAPKRTSVSSAAFGFAPDAAVIPPAAPIALSSAQSCAEGASNLSALCGAIAGFNHPLKQFVKNAVMPHFAENRGAGLLIITDAPSADDDGNAKILTGTAGELMNKMLGAIGLSRDTVSIAPLVFWRTPGGRIPAREELDLAKPFVDRAIVLLKPKAILTLGILTAAEIAKAKLPKDHGGQFESENGIPVFPIYHPNYLMLKPDAKKDAWVALQKLQKFLKNSPEPL
ncbi:MAG: uracil-DNA glycosylase [Rickettsiales bacterium]|nr:uracil-DNA glycosylase [Rickettsiales bacterium]